MTSISAINQFARVSPRELLQNELLSEISSGTISSTDQEALTAALDDIDSALRSSAESSRAAGSRPPSPTEMKSKIDDLIAGEVDKGTITSDQADELKAIFSNALPQGGPRDGGGPGGPGGAGGPPPVSGEKDSESTSSSTETDVTELLQEFLKSLQQSLSKNGTYSDSGVSSLSITSLVVNYQT